MLSVAEARLEGCRQTLSASERKRQTEIGEGHKFSEAQDISQTTIQALTCYEWGRGEVSEGQEEEGISKAVVKEEEVEILSLCFNEP